MWGMNYEHSAGEGPAIFITFEELTEKVDAMSPPEETTVPSHLPAPEKLEWHLSEQSLNDIRDAMISFDAWVTMKHVFSAVETFKRTFSIIKKLRS